MANDQPPPGKMWLYTKRITLKNGKVLYASSFGKKAFRIAVPAK